MHENYEDIKSKIALDPLWYDLNGVPRYAIFTPQLCPNIYATHVGLFLIACQECGEQFQVEMHDDVFGMNLRHPPSKWHYGDPPAHNCIGDTMNCEDLEVIEFWTRESYGDWQRRPAFEGEIKVVRE